MRMNKIALIATALLMVMPLFTPVQAVSRTAPYDSGEGFFTNCHGNSAGWWFWNRLDGRLEVRSEVGGFGNCDATARLGISYPSPSATIPGWSSFSTTARTNIQMVGQTFCATGAGGLVADVTLTMQLWRWTGSAWSLTASRDLGRFDCWSQTNWNQQVIGDAFWSFQPGNTYRVSIEAKSHAFTQASIGIGHASFCQPAQCWPGSNGHKITINSISLDNVAPVANFPTQRVWYGNQVSSGGSSTGRGCDHDGNVVRLRVEVSSFASEGAVGPSTCASRSVSWQFLVPGTYIGTTKAWDNDGATTTHQGSVAVEILPTTTASVQGFPPLENVDPTQLGPSVHVETLVKTDGAIRAYRVTTGNSILYDTLTTTIPDSTDSLVGTFYNRVVSTTTIKQDGVEKWSGTVVQFGSSWWHIKPLSDTVIAPAEAEPADTTNVSPPPSSTEPESDSGTY